MKKCNNCHQMMEDSHLFCPYCGMKWEQTCMNCGNRDIPANARFCPQCGSKLDGSDNNSGNQQKPFIKNLPEFVLRIIDNMVMVEGGTFMMGATSEQGSDATSDEEPIHQVTLSTFSICRYLITVEQWYGIMDDDDLFESLEHIANDDDSMPMTGLSWDMCQDFINKLNQLTGKRFRLPTEAEWEFAARGGQKSCGFKYAGSNSLEEVAWFDEKDSTPQYPGQKQSNELGLYDMSGNVAEFCSDYYKRYETAPSVNPRICQGALRVIRGGHNRNQCRVSWREAVHQDWSFEDVGFRLALYGNMINSSFISSLCHMGYRV